METVHAKPLVEGALLAALVALLGLLSFYSGFGWLQPIPVLLAYVRNGARNALLVVIIGAGLLALWIGPLAALASLVFVAALGLTPGWAVARGAGAGAVIAVMTLAVLVGAAAGAVAALLIWHANLWTEVWDSLRRLLDTHSGLVRWVTGKPPHQFGALLLRIAPAAAVLAAAVQAVGVYALSAAMLRRMGHSLPAVPDFVAWRAPRWLAGLYVAGIAGIVLPVDKVPAIAALNLTIALGAVYSVVGFAFLYGQLRAQGVGRGAAILVLVGSVGLIDRIGLGCAPTILGLASSLWIRSPARDGSATDEGEFE